MEVVCLFTTVSIPDDLVYVWKYTILALFGLKLYHEMEGDGVWYGIIVLEVLYPTPHSIDIKLCYSL